MKKQYLLMLLLIISFTGCAIHSNEARLVPNASNLQKKYFYVIHSNLDKRNIDEAIADVLIEKGFKATSGNSEEIPNSADVIVTYEDRWMWDMGNYLIQLEIQFRDSKDNYPFVVGENIRTSLIRKSPKYMANEVIEEMILKMNKGI